MSYVIHKADLITHKSSLLELWRRNYGHVVEGRYEWMYERNPAGNPIVFLLYHEQSETYVGSISMFPRALYVGQKITKAYICGDMVVDTQHRSLGPAIKLLKATITQCQQENPCVLISVPNDKSEPVTLRVGFKKLDDFVEMTYVLRTKKYLMRHIKSQFLAGVMAFPLDWLICLRYEIFTTLHAKNYHYELVETFDHCIDQTFDAGLDQYSFIGVRDSKFLNWRVSSSPYNKHGIFLLKTKNNNQACGYIAFTQGDNRAHIVDFSSDGKEKTIKMLFLLFTRYQRDQECDSISLDIAAHQSLLGFIKERGFSLRGRKNLIVTFSSLAELDLTKLVDTKPWYLTAADNDI